VTDLTAKTIAELREGFRAGEFTAREVAEQYNKAVASARALNAYTLETPDDALAAADAADKALAQIGLGHADIDVLVTVCSTGIATPSLDARLMQVRPFRPDVERLPVFGLGCAGGVLGLARAASMARAAPDKRVLLLVVERLGPRATLHVVPDAGHSFHVRDETIDAIVTWIDGVIR